MAYYLLEINYVETWDFEVFKTCFLDDWDLTNDAGVERPTSFNSDTLQGAILLKNRILEIIQMTGTVPI